ncbi:carboxylesterase/lipase family protein [Sphingomonas floccifaciens]|uniref:Carboxylic ester hydrolase n=1 Tax=Sphingomonas floccifaciens TaxID=1844115 RepID=A0ABW4N7S6_9SPHN
MRAITIVLATLGLAYAAAASAAPDPGSPTVTTAAGRIEGIGAPGGVSAFLGIPYAAPPVRELRWRDPQPAVRWTGTYHADRLPPQCIQPLRAGETNQYPGADVTSEDCLYLNVWTKPGLRKAPVVVFIHGGGFFIGSSRMPLYAGEQVAQRGAVFVNLNYRLGVLGFLAHPALSAESPHKTSGNYAFLDQIAALKWVKANIARFGGDPDNVTIAGQSAGSMSVLALQASPLTRGLFQRAVGMSGALLGSGGPGAMRPLADGEREGARFLDLMKAKSLAALRLMPADRLVVPRVPGSPSVGPIQDGYVLPTPVEQAFADRRQNDVPLLLGFARDESLGGMGPVKDLADYRARVAERFGTRAEQFLTLYPAATDAEAREQARLADRDATMVGAMKSWATLQTRYGTAPVYSYMFARPHSYVPGVTFPDLDPATAGAYHTSEVPYWLGTLDSFNLYRKTRAWTPADRAFSATMTDALIAFARSGTPGTAWPRFDPAAPKLVELGQTMRTGDWPDERRLAFFRDTPAPTRPAGGALRD